MEIAGRSPLESIMIEHAVHAARLDTDKVLMYTRKTFKKVYRPDSLYPLGANIDFEMVSIEEIWNLMGLPEFSALESRFNDLEGVVETPERAVTGKAG